MRHPPRLIGAFFVAALLAAAAVPGCRPSATPEEPPLRSVAERGPIRFVVEVSPLQVWIADPITVSLTVTAPDDIALALPDAAAFGDISIRSSTATDPRPSPDGGQVWKQTVIVESLVSGAVEIPPLVVKYGRKPTDGSAPVLDNELVTDTLKVEVRSALTSQDSVASPRDIVGTRIPPREPWTWTQIGILSASIFAALVLAFLVWRTAKKWLTRPISPIQPEVWALRELEALRARDWVATGETREYYYRLSTIVRRYIELKFTLAAPDMTTEEFLSTLTRRESALPYDSARLRQFLEACDLVKYAAYAPRTEDAADAMLTARAFIHATAAAAAEHARELIASREVASEPPQPVSSGGPAV